jgi:SNF2 family DNA or RNA helicase
MDSLIKEHVYDILIQSDDPQMIQPQKITIQMKPHQLAALHKMCVMERCGKVYYHVDDPARYIEDANSRRFITFKGNFNIKSNIGIMGDIVGYGKTLTALSLIAANPLRNLAPATNEEVPEAEPTRIESESDESDSDDSFQEEIDVTVTPSPENFGIYRERDAIYSYNTRNYASFTATCERTATVDNERYIQSTLVVVPRGPVYIQWENAIRNQTSLRVLSLDSLYTIRRMCPSSRSNWRVIKAFFENYDIVLIKNTSLKTLMDHFQRPSYVGHPIVAWERIMIDEAHDIISRMPIFSFRFLWLISGTYSMLVSRSYGSRNQMSFAIRDILLEERLNVLLIKGNPEFVRASFTVPAPIEHSYLCALSSNITALQPFLQPNLRELINANDIKGLIREMGGTNETEDDIVQLVTREMQRELANKERELEFYNSLDISEEQKENRIATLNIEINRIKERMNNLTERVTMLADKPCPICYETFTNPIMLPCTHVFCGGCLIGWMRNGCNCPQCRAPIESQQLIAIIKEDEKNDLSASTERPVLLSKEETFIKLLQDKPEGRFLVFSRIDSGFFQLSRLLLRHEIPYSEMKGSTSQMMRILERFREGELRVILLNTYYAGSGIDISYATDLVLFHSMGLDQVQAIGRAQRVGRTEPLHIHTLMYSTETN